MATAIRFDKVSKVYRLGESQGSLRHSLANWGRALIGRGRAVEEHLLWALRDVSFEVDEGEALGIIGPNGAGKTTTLKLLSRITQPTTGRIRVSGRVSALIELGAGFHPDLTGRDNIYLNGAILGLKQREIDRKFDSIVAFSELEPFIDTPVKRYSSGMYVRLGFAVAAQTASDILLVDEVLAVGDAAFQAKCFAQIKKLQQAGLTIVLISHQLANIQRVCKRALLLRQGQVAAEGGTEEVISQYYQTVQVESTRSPEETAGREVSLDDGAVSIVKVAVLDGNFKEQADFEFAEDIRIRVCFHASSRVEWPVFSISVRSTDAEVYTGYVTKFDGVDVPFIQGSGHVDLLLSGPGLGAGTYEVNVGIWDRDYVGGYDWRWSVTTFRITSTEQRVMGRFHLPHEWEVAAGASEPETDGAQAGRPV